MTVSTSTNSKSTKGHYRTWDKSHIRSLFEKYQATGDLTARDELATTFYDLASFLANKFVNRGEPIDDLRQVALLTMFRAFDRFDLDKGVEFSTFATPTILGELKRYFRDKGWAMKVPRKLQELSISLSRVINKLCLELDREPTISELAAEMEVTEEEVIEVYELARSQYILSFSMEFAGESDNEGQAIKLLDYLGLEEEAFDTIINRQALKKAFQSLEPIERLALYLRFYENHSQVRIANVLGFSQIRVSRMQARALKKLQALLADEQSSQDEFQQKSEGAITRWPTNFDDANRFISYPPPPKMGVISVSIPSSEPPRVVVIPVSKPRKLIIPPSGIIYPVKRLTDPHSADLSIILRKHRPSGISLKF